MTQPQRGIPDDNLAYPVLIRSNADSGSGFFMNTGTAVYLVTANHVLFRSKSNEPLAQVVTLLSYSKDLSDNVPNSFTVDIGKLGQDNVKQDVDQDIAALRLFRIDSDAAHDPRLLNAFPGVTINMHARSGILGAAKENTRKFSDVLIGNDAIIFGYPTSLSIKEAPQIDINRPLLRKGIVAGVNMQTHSIILDCPVYFGNSGGPAVEVDHLPEVVKIIGVVTQYVPYQDGGMTFLIRANSGYSVVTPMDYVLNLLQ